MRGESYGYSFSAFGEIEKSFNGNNCWKQLCKILGNWDGGNLLPTARVKAD